MNIPLKKFSCESVTGIEKQEDTFIFCRKLFFHFISFHTNIELIRQTTFFFALIDTFSVIKEKVFLSEMDVQLRYQAICIVVFLS